MNFIMTVATVVVSFLATWFILGLLLFTSTPVLIVPGTPWGAKLMAAGIAGFFFPWAWLTGKRPTMSMITPKNTTPDEDRIIKEWLKGHCQCPDCRAKRGE